MSEDEPAYRVEPQGPSYAVVDETGTTVCACADERNAEQYAVLLNQAYRRGYKAGYRSGKRSR